MSQDSIIVYWAMEDQTSRGGLYDLNIFAPEINSLYKQTVTSKNKRNQDSFFRCPAVKNLMEQTFVIKMPTASSYSHGDEGMIPDNESSLSTRTPHPPSIDGNPLFILGYSFYFFAEESLDMTLSSPFFSNSPHLQHAALVPGTFDIGSWFRMVSPEFNIWSGHRQISFEEGEDIAYIRFHTDKKIVLKRFLMNERLAKISDACASSMVWEPKVSLLKRYKRFYSSKTRNIVLQEIKERLVNE